jgi:hypothetical protein
VRRYIARVLLLAILVSAPLFGQTAPSSNSSTAPATNSNAVGAAPDWFLVGQGTSGYVSRFVAPYKLSNSNIFQSPNGNIGIGMTTPTVPLQVFSNNPLGSNGYGPITMWVESSADNAQGAVYAVSSSSVGGNAVNGEAYGIHGNGVIGQGGANGVVGATSTTSGFATGVTGFASGNSGPGVGVFGQVQSSEGIAGLFINRPGGDILQGRINTVDLTVFRVDGTGRVFADGGFQPSGADFAESMTVAGDRAKYSAGDLLVIDPTANRRVALAQQPYSTLVAGIYSTKPGLLGSTRRVDESASPNEIPLAVVGIVPCKVTAENGPIQIGDLLVTSSAPGRAMKGTDRSKLVGAVVGKALEALAAGEGTIQVLVTLQ